MRDVVFCADLTKHSNKLERFSVGCQNHERGLAATQCSQRLLEPLDDQLAFIGLLYDVKDCGVKAIISKWKCVKVAGRTIHWRGIQCTGELGHGLDHVVRDEGGVGLWRWMIARR